MTTKFGKMNFVKGDERLRKMAMASEREQRLEQGYYDGRFASKVVPSKKRDTKSKYKIKTYEYA